MTLGDFVIYIFFLRPARGAMISIASRHAITGRRGFDAYAKSWHADRSEADEGTPSLGAIRGDISSTTCGSNTTLGAVRKTDVHAGGRPCEGRIERKSGKSTLISLVRVSPAMKCKILCLQGLKSDIPLRDYGSAASVLPE